MIRPKVVIDLTQRRDMAASTPPGCNQPPTECLNSPIQRANTHTCLRRKKKKKTGQRRKSKRAGVLEARPCT